MYIILHKIHFYPLQNEISLCSWGVYSAEDLFFSLQQNFIFFFPPNFFQQERGKMEKYFQNSLFYFNYYLSIFLVFFHHRGGKHETKCFQYYFSLFPLSHIFYPPPPLAGDPMENITPAYLLPNQMSGVYILQI